MRCQWADSVYGGRLQYYKVHFFSCLWFITQANQTLRSGSLSKMTWNLTNTHVDLFGFLNVSEASSLSSRIIYK